MSTPDLRYPIGRYSPPSSTEAAERERWIADIEALPSRLRAAIDGLSAEQLDTPYRPGGWTVRQVVHHLPDSHLNSYTRFKLALTEDEPTIRPYDEVRWAKLPDARSAAPELSLALLEALHARWAVMLRAMSDSDFARTFRHPESGRTFSLGETLALYAWHSRHHVAHITSLRQRMGWTAQPALAAHGIPET